MHAARLAVQAIGVGVSLYWIYKDFKKEKKKQEDYENGKYIKS